METTSASQTLERAAREMPAVAERAASVDATPSIDPLTPSATPGEQAFAAELQTRGSMLRSSQSADEESNESRLATITRLEKDRAAGMIEPPADVPKPRFIPWELLPLGAAVAAEVTALQAPVVTMLQFEEGSIEGFAISCVIAFVAAICGHFAGEALAAVGEAEDNARPGWRRERDRHARRARWMVAAVGLVALFAVAARISTASLAAALAGEGGLDGASFAGFTAFQVVFAVLAVVLGWSLSRRWAAARARRTDSWWQECLDEKTTLQARIESAAERRGEGAQELEQIGALAFATYRAELMNRLDTVAAMVEWTDRFATQSRQGWTQSAPLGPSSPQAHAASAPPTPEEQPPPPRAETDDLSGDDRARVPAEDDMGPDPDDEGPHREAENAPESDSEAVGEGDDEPHPDGADLFDAVLA